MTLKEYQKFVRLIAKRFENPTEKIMTWGLGLSGEAGDVAGCIKKTVSHGDDQREGIRENLGDTIWYLAAIANHFDWDLDEIITENKLKLEKRYPSGKFTKKHAKKRERIDWNEER